jgi:L-fuculose-phosphate aldolase
VSSGFATEDDARQALIDHGRAMGTTGVDIGQAGALSLRWPRSAAAGMLITPAAVTGDPLVVDDIVWMPLAATAPPAGDGRRRPPSQWRLHRDILVGRDDVGSVLDAHGPESSTLACSGRIQHQGIPAFHCRVAVAGGADIRCSPYARLGTRRLSDDVLAALDGRRACLVAHRGLVVAARSPAAAVALAIDVEGLCAQYRRLLALGDPVVLDRSEIEDIVAAWAGEQG